MSVYKLRNDRRSERSHHHRVRTAEKVEKNSTRDEHGQPITLFAFSKPITNHLDIS